MNIILGPIPILLPRTVLFPSRACQVFRSPRWRGVATGCCARMNSGTGRGRRAGVDASRGAMRRASEAGADLVIVPHGLFWSASHPWTGRRYELLRLLVENNLAVYSSHLPLDAHPRLGNNAQLARALGLRELKPFFFEKGRHLGVRGTLAIGRAELQIGRASCRERV